MKHVMITLTLSYCFNTQKQNAKYQCKMHQCNVRCNSCELGNCSKTRTFVVIIDLFNQMEFTSSKMFMVCHKKSRKMDLLWIDHYSIESSKFISHVFFSYFVCLQFTLPTLQLPSWTPRWQSGNTLASHF